MSPSDLPFPTTPLADVSVRPALAADAPILGRLHVASWRQTYADVLGPEVVAGFDAEAFGSVWAEALSQHRGGNDRHHLLVACAGADVVGFTAVQPAGDSDADATDGELTALIVGPEFQRVGHGSRLVAAAVDHLRGDGLTTARIWVLDGDPAREAFLESAGFGLDGAWRELEITPDRRVKETRWVTAL